MTIKYILNSKCIRVRRNSVDSTVCLLQENKTALYWAVEKGNATMVRDILQCNPDTETTTKVKNGKTCVKGIVSLF